MKLFTYSAAALLALIPATQAQGGFYEVCEPSTFEYNVIVTGTYWTGFVITPWLSGDCLGQSGTYTNTTLDLNTCLQNNDGSLEWKKDGHFDASCQCDIDSLPNICCTCEKNNNAQAPGVCMNLDQQVAVVNGQLACPDVPA